MASWENNCHDNGSGLNFDNTTADAIAVLVVQTGDACNITTALYF
jgi:hypothetical protein